MADPKKPVAKDPVQDPKPVAPAVKEPERLPAPVAPPKPVFPDHASIGRHAVVHRGNGTYYCLKGNWTVTAAFNADGALVVTEDRLKTHVGVLVVPCTEEQWKELHS